MEGKNSSRVSREVAIFAGWWDKHYGLDLARSLLEAEVSIDFLASEEMDDALFRSCERVRFIKVWGEQVEGGGKIKRLAWVVKSYLRIFAYALFTKAKVFHVLWNNKFQHFDRTVLMLFYRLLRKRIVFTAHNVNAGERDGRNSRLNRWTLRIQYRLVHQIFVHTQRMREELESGFNVPPGKITVIPYGMNDSVPETDLKVEEAKARLGIESAERAVLYFGKIAPYKGIEYLVEAMLLLWKIEPRYRLIVAGAPKDPQCAAYWDSIDQKLSASEHAHRVIKHIEFIEDEYIELFFKGADVFVLPYTSIFQSGILFLGFRFGLPAIASDVGSLREDVIDGKTGFLCRAQDAEDLARGIQDYFKSPLFRGLAGQRAAIRNFVWQRHSWTQVGRTTRDIYMRLLDGRRCDGADA